MPPRSLRLLARHVKPITITTVEHTQCINDLPVEVLTEIFRCAKGFDESHTLSRRNAPLNYTWVCRYWRAIAHGDPRLWTTLVVGVVRKKIPDLVAIVKHWAECAGLRPLTITYNFPKKKTLEAGVIQASLRPFIASRVRHLELNLAKYIPLFDDPLPDTSPLETFSYRCSDLDAAWPRSSSSSQMANFGGCLHLRTVVFGSNAELDEGDIDHHRDAMRSVPITFPWSRLTSLKLLEANLNAFRAAKILRKCVNLVDCELSMGHWCRTAEPRRPKPPAVLEHLTSLVVRSLCRREEGAKNGVCPLLKAITLPALTTLSLTVAWTPSDALSQALRQLQQRSHFSLQHLTLSGDIDPDHLQDHLLRNPTLESLTFSSFGGHSYVGLWNSLRRWKGHTNTFLPNLTKLDLSTLALWVQVCDYGFLQSRDVSPLLRDCARHQLELMGRSEEISEALISRTWSEEEPAYMQAGLAKLEKITLRTWRSSLGVEKLGRRQPCAGQEWIAKPYNLPPLQRRLEACEAVIDFPVEFVDELGDDD